MRATQPWRTNRSRVLRSNAPSAEVLLWRALRNRRLTGLKFVRQHPIGPYFADFACRESKIVIEVDGATHSTASEVQRDAERDAYLAAEGYRVFRMHNADVRDNLNGVLVSICAFIANEGA